METKKKITHVISGKKSNMTIINVINGNKKTSKPETNGQIKLIYR